MADVGVLNLQIHDNSADAATGLGQLADALERVKKAASRINYDNVATGLKRIADVVNDSVSGSTLVKLGQFSDALSKLQGLGNVNVKINGGKAVETVAETIEKANTNFSGINTGFEEFGQRAVEAKGSLDEFNESMQRTNELMQSSSFGRTANQFRMLFEMMNQYRMAYALPASQDNAMSTNVENGWTYWKNGATEVEGTVTSVADTIDARLEGTQQRLYGMTGAIESITDMDERIQQRREAMQRDDFDRLERNYGQYRELYMSGEGDWQNSVPNMYGLTGESIQQCETYAEALKMTMQYVNDYIDQFINKTNTSPGPLLSDAIDAAMDAKLSFKNAKESASVFENTPAVSETADAMDQASIKTRSFGEALRSAAKTAKELVSSFKEIMLGSSSLGESIGKMFPTLSGLVHRFSQIARYRLLRAVLKQITEGFKEGLENVYEYSKSINGSFAPAMDSAASALLQMKNAIGAAAAPLIEALIPYLKMAVDWLINIINYINQFFALMNGQTTWTRALPATTTAFNNQSNAAKKASKSMKDLLADWDELNIIQNKTKNNGGGGGSSSSTNYAEMFEQATDFAGWIRDAANFLKDNFDDILKIAGDIGTILLGWKLSNAFSGAIGLLGSWIALGATIALTLDMTRLFNGEYVESGDPGWLIADVLSTAIGTFAAYEIAKQIAGGGFGTFTAGATLILDSIVSLEYAKNAYAQGKDAESKMLKLLGSVKAGIGWALAASAMGASAPVAVGVGVLGSQLEVLIETLAEVNITGIAWGENSKTHEDVVAFVQGSMYSVPVAPTIEVIDATLKKGKDLEDSLTKQATTILPTINALKLGIDTDSTLKQLKEDILGEGGLLKKFKENALQQSDLVKTTEGFVPTIDENGVNVSEQLMKDSSSGWSELTSIMDELGADLSRHLTKAMDTTLSEELRQFEMGAVQEIAETMTNVALAGERAVGGSDSLTDLIFNLKDASKGTFQDIVDTFAKYKQQLEEEYKKAKKEEAGTFAKQSAMYETLAQSTLEKAQAAGEGTPEYEALMKKYKYYLDQAEKFKTDYNLVMEEIKGSVDEAVEAAAAPGKRLMQEAFREMLANAREVQGAFENGQIIGMRRKAAGGIDDYVQLGLQNFQGQLNNLYETRQVDAQTSEGFKTFLQSIIQGLFPEDFDVIKSMLDAGLINYTNIFSDEIVKQLTAQFGFDYGNGLNLWQMLWDNLLQGEASTDNTLEVTIDSVEVNTEGVDIKQKVREQINDAIKDGVLGLDEKQSIVDNMLNGNMGSFLQIMREMGISVDTNGNVIGYGGSKVVTPGATVTNAPTVQSPYTTQTEQEDGMSTAVAKGTSEGNSQQNDILNDIMESVRQILNKKWVVNITPGSDWAQHNARSANAMGMVTGEEW